MIEIHAKRPDRPSEITKRFAKSRRVFARKLGSDSVSICQCVRENIPLLCEEGNILPKPKLPNFKLSHDKDEFIADDEIASIIVYTSIMPTDLAQISNILGRSPSLPQPGSAERATASRPSQYQRRAKFAHWQPHRASGQETITVCKRPRALQESSRRLLR